MSTWSTGGAALAASRLSSSLEKLGIESQIAHMPTRIPAYIDALIGKLTMPINTIFHSYNYFGVNLESIINSYNPDLVHIHWIGAGFIRPESLANIHLPIVWTLHDLWPLCGGEHLPGSLTRFANGYKKSNRPKGESGLDLDRYVWERKVGVWKDIDITYVAPSIFVQDLSSKSFIFNGYKPRYIPNGLDINIYAPQKSSKKSKTILVCAPNLLEDSNKGFDLFIQSLSYLNSKIKKEIKVLIVGATMPAKDPIEAMGIQSKYLGIITDQAQMAQLYNSADVTVVPSRMETLSFVTMESLSCGTPVAAFNVGGLSDLINHQINGYLAKPLNPKDLARGIMKILNKKIVVKLSDRKRILNKFSIDNVGQQYLELYRELIKRYNKSVNQS